MTLLKDYYQMLANHDWYFNYSSDSKVYRRGQESFAKLSMITKESEEHNKLFDAYFDYVWRDAEKPVCPE